MPPDRKVGRDFRRGHSLAIKCHMSRPPPAEGPGTELDAGVVAPRHRSESPASARNIVPYRLHTNTIRSFSAYHAHPWFQSPSAHSTPSVPWLPASNRAMMRNPARSSGSTSSDTGPPPGRKVIRRGGRCGGSATDVRPHRRSSSGNTPLSSASAFHRATRSSTTSGWRPEMSRASAKSSSRLNKRPVVVLEAMAPRDQGPLQHRSRPDMVGGRLPPVVVDRPGPDHLEVLGRPGARRVRSRERVQQAAAVDRELPVPIDVARGLHPAGVEDRRQQIDGMAELAPHRARLADPARPPHDQRRADTAEPGEPLPEPERRVAGPGPSPGVVVERPQPAKQLDPGQSLGAITLVVADDPVIVGRSDQPALRAGPVVGEHQHDRVVEHADGLRGTREPGRPGRRCGSGSRRTPPCRGRTAGAHAAGRSSHR